MRTYTIPANLLDKFNGIEIKSASVRFRGQDYTVKVYDDGSGLWWIHGHEFGPTMLIRADSETSAFEIFVDESKPIDASDLPEAYGIIDWLREIPGFDWHQSDDSVSFEANQKMASQLLRLFFEDRRNETHMFLDWITLVKQKFPALTNDQSAELANALANLPDHGWDLVEGYEYQPNATDTGIVNLGHYHWMEEIADGDIQLEIEAEEIHADIAGEYGARELLLDGSRGIYLPQGFAQGFDNWGVKYEDRDILSDGPDHPDYWETWDDVLNYAHQFTHDGNEWHLEQDDSLFAVRSDVYFD